MKDLRALGVSNIIEMTNRYMGRNPQFMLDLMRDTGINVVACTGYYGMRSSLNMLRPEAWNSSRRRWLMR